MSQATSGVSRAGGWARAIVTVVPVWLHIAWLIWIVPVLGIFVSENVFGLLNALWFIPLGLTLLGSLLGWVKEWVVWTMVMSPYAVLLFWVGFVMTS